MTVAAHIRLQVKVLQDAPDHYLYEGVMSNQDFVLIVSSKYYCYFSI